MSLWSGNGHSSVVLKQNNDEDLGLVRRPETKKWNEYNFYNFIGALDTMSRDIFFSINLTTIEFESILSIQRGIELFSFPQFLNRLLLFSYIPPFLCVVARIYGCRPLMGRRHPASEDTLFGYTIIASNSNCVSLKLWTNCNANVEHLLVPTPLRTLLIWALWHL